MYSKEQRAKALRIYHQIGAVTDTVRQLGYPSREHLYTWIRNEGKTKEKRKKLNLKNTTEHPRNPPAEFKLKVLRRCFENGESVKLVSEDTGYSRVSIYVWRKRYLQGGVFSLMNTKNKTGKITGYGWNDTFRRSRIIQKADIRASIGSRYLKGDNQRIKKRPRRRLERPEEQGEGSGDRRHEREVPATSPASKDKSV